jgi:deoxyribose-phosphate aldolase
MSSPAMGQDARVLPPWLQPHGHLRGLAGLVDATLLRPEATGADIHQLCDDAAEVGAAFVCVNGAWVRRCVQRLRGSSTRVVSVVGFPLGAAPTMIKAAEARLAVLDGASEIDVVMALGLVKAGDWAAVRDEISVVVGAANGRPVKVILESTALTPEEIIQGCKVTGEAGGSFVKTSTGFHPGGGATIEAVALMRRTVGLTLGVKASGGIRTCEDAVRMLAAGADRIGTSSLRALERCAGREAPTLDQLLGAAG